MLAAKRTARTPVHACLDTTNGKGQFCGSYEHHTTREAASLHEQVFAAKRKSMR